jgi:hypothetical protein
MLVTVAGWVFLVLTGPAVSIPLQQRSVPSPLIWPVLAAAATQLASTSQARCWEARSHRNLLWLQAAWTLVVGATNVLVGVALIPLPSVLAAGYWYLALTGIGLIGIPLFADAAWLPLACVSLVAVYDMSLFDSPLRDLLERHSTIAAVGSFATFTAGFLTLLLARRSDVKGVRAPWAVRPQ